MSDAQAAAVPANTGHNERWLFWACFISLVTTAFGFVVRAQVIDTWGIEFNLTQTQKGEILGVGFWPFAISIVLFSLVVDRIGYGKAMIFAFVCHVASGILTILADGYWSLYWATFIMALGAGTVEAVINPVVATLFSRDKTKWLNILHAGWPGGLVLGGVLALLMGPQISWKFKVALIFVPTAVYGVMMLGRKFPVHERVAAGVSYRDMLREAGVLGCLIVVILMVRELGRVIGLSDILQLVVVAVIVGAYGAYVQCLGRLMFVFLLVIMIPLGTTELGTDGWITSLMEPEMAKLGAQAGWVLVYTSLIMMVLRFCAGPIAHALSPLGLLAACSAIAALGLIALSHASGLMIFAAATLYGIGKTFFWPTMLGVTSERFPKGGALTINGMGGVGMLGAGVIGLVLLGNIQDKAIDHALRSQKPDIYAKVVGADKVSVFGSYQSIDGEKVKTLDEGEQKAVGDITVAAKKKALATVAIFPAIMLICYLALIVYFRAEGGYKAEVLGAPDAAASASGADPGKPAQA